MYDKSDILGLSSCFILLGSCLLYLNFGITNLDGIYVLSSLSEINGLEALVETNQYFNLALLIMSVGYLFKVSAAPFHFWSPAIWSGISYMWERLSNSGNLLELLIPNYIRKAISGWTNHSCKVTSQKTYENNVEYRGSKSDIFNLKTKFKIISVKEQRVDGSQFIHLTQLRYTLLDFERNSLIKIPSNQNQQRRVYSTVKIDKAKILKETNELTLLSIAPSCSVSSSPTVSEKIYPNSDTCKGQILSENKKKSGIYMFENTINGKRYIGSSDNLNRRFSYYFNVNYLLKNKCMAICCALIKHGFSKFSLTILEYCEVSELLEREKYWWKLFKPEYNIAQDPSAPFSGRKHSDKSKTIMSDAKKIHNPGGFKPGENHPNYGQTLSDETKTKISDTKKGRNLSDETKTKIQDAQPTSQPIEVTDLETKTTTSYNSIREAAKALDIRWTTIKNYIARNQQKPYKGQYTFKKIE